MTPSPLLLLIVGGAALRLALAGAIGLGVDESYMVAAGRTLQWGYFDHPPLSWWLSSGIAHLIGSEAAIVVRLPFIALFAVSTWLMARLTAVLFDARAGLWAAIAFNLAPVFGLTIGGWVLPDGPLICALLAAAYCLVRGLEGRHFSWWVAAGAMAGLALLSKYSAVLVLFGAVVAIASVPAWRPWLRRPHPYVAAVVALLVFSPVLIWNARNGWVSLAFQGGRAAAARFQPWGPLVVLAGAAGFLLPWIWAGLLAGLMTALRRGRGDRGDWLLASLALPPILVFAVVALWSRNPLFHWAMPGYLFLFPLLGARLAEWRPIVARRWALGTAGLIALVLAAAVGEIRFNWLAIVRPGFDPGLQAVDLTPLRGVLAARGLLGHAIATPTWNDTGKIDFALGGTPPVLCLNLDARQYGLLPGPAGRIGEDILIVAPRQDEARVRRDYGAIFDAIETVAPAVLAFPGRGSVSIPLFIGRGLKRWP